MPRYKYNDETRDANIIPVCQENAAVSFKVTSRATVSLLFRKDTDEADALFTQKHRSCRTLTEEADIAQGHVAHGSDFKPVNSTVEHFNA